MCPTSALSCVSDLEKVIADSDVLVVGLSDVGTLDALKRLVREDQVVVDLIRISEPEKLRGRHVGLCW